MCPELVEGNMWRFDELSAHMSAQLGRIHPDPERATALPRATDCNNFFRGAHQLGALTERSAHGQALDDRF
jgi:hypothetical protein